MTNRSNTFILLLLALLLASCARAQDSAAVVPSLVEIPPYKFVDFKANVLRFPVGRGHIDTFYAKLRATLAGNSGHVSIVQVGGSHVQAGYFTHRVRTDLSLMTDSAKSGRGIIFPFKALKTNAPRSYSFCSSGEWERLRCVTRDISDTLGLSGVAVRTADASASLALSLNSGDSLGWTFNRLRVLGSASNAWSYPYIIYKGDTLFAARPEGENGYVFAFPEAADTAFIRFHLERGGRFTFNGVIPESDAAGITFHAVGVNGAAVPAWLRCKGLKRDLELVRPDLAIFSIGINDANVPAARFNPEEFKSNYRRLVDQFLEVNPSCALIFITNNDCYTSLGRRYAKRCNPNTAKAEKAFLELAREYEAGVWNLYRVMGGFNSSTKWMNAKMMRRDRIHFTAAGYNLLGDLFYNAVLTDYLRADESD